MDLTTVSSIFGTNAAQRHITVLLRLQQSLLALLELPLNLYSRLTLPFDELLLKMCEP